MAKNPGKIIAKTKKKYLVKCISCYLILLYNDELQLK